MLSADVVYRSRENVFIASPLGQVLHRRLAPDGLRMQRHQIKQLRGDVTADGQSEVLCRSQLGQYPAASLLKSLTDTFKPVRGLSSLRTALAASAIS